MQTPLLNILAGLDGRTRMHMPGHKGIALPYTLPCPAWDTTELLSTDDLYHPAGGIAQAEALAAASAGAAHTLLLTGGSTAGLLAMLLSAVPPDGKVIVPRNAHHAVLSACVLGGLVPVYVWPHVTDDGVAYFTPEDYIQTMRAHEDAHAVLVTRPDYYGICMDVQAVAAHARAQGMRLLVDEAHGAHLNWMHTLPSALAQGAHMSVQSAHKTLPALTSGAWLHLAAGEDETRARRKLRTVQTSSPSFLIMASLDGARAYMDSHGAQALVTLNDALVQARAHLCAYTGLFDGHEAWRMLPHTVLDPTRLVIDVSARCQTGWHALALLGAQGIDLEMADARRVVAIATVCDACDTALRVVEALASMQAQPARAKADVQEQMDAQALARACLLMRPVSACSPREAALAPTRMVPLGQAVGRVAAGAAGLYPPGIPLVVPGERWPCEAVEALIQAVSRHAQTFGITEGCVPCMA